MLLQYKICMFCFRVPEVSVLLVNTKVPRSTKKLVAGVKEKYDMVFC